MNRKVAVGWYRFAQIGSLLLLGALTLGGVEAIRTLQNEGAKSSAIFLAGALLFIAAQLWAIFFVLLMVFLDPKRAARTALIAWQRRRSH
ncbi:MAG TPA: hypothetical protein VN625_02025 [Desulfuromonadaceae bacterium]|nr:hypothetical protein [Desulfuromonadaceae bacterium]